MGRYYITSKINEKAGNLYGESNIIIIIRKDQTEIINMEDPQMNQTL